MSDVVDKKLQATALAVKRGEITYGELTAKENKAVRQFLKDTPTRELRKLVEAERDERRGPMPRASRAPLANVRAW